jgi:putative RNA 2'-phosphotransferase
MDQQSAIRLSKTIAHALRHAPWLYELEIDDAGWVPLDQLLNGLRGHRAAWANLTEADIAEVVDGFDKKRYELREGKIRAYYGHTLKTMIRKVPSEPPERLYHGTAAGVVPLILDQGLKPMSRQYVHLSAEIETAQDVGARKGGEVVLLVIRAREAHADGVVFYHGNEMVWLADEVPAAYITRWKSR